jgi:hypothetical protein
MSHPNRPTPPYRLLPTHSREPLPTSPLDPIGFKQFASAIAGLIKEASGESDLLRQATDQSRATRQSLTETAAEIEAKLTRFAGLIPVIEQRLAEIEQLLSAAAARAATPTIDDLDDRIAEAIREHLRSHLLRDLQPHVERLIAARLDGFLTDFGALTFPEGRRAA